MAFIDSSRSARTAWTVACLVAGGAGGTPLAGQQAGDQESILFLEIPTVHGASKFDQIATEAPASVTVITAEEIARHNWRTLAEVLDHVRGFFTTYDRSYTYLAARGFGRPGDYSTRILLLLDGQRANELVYESGYYGSESVVDVADIDRVEVIRGPGSSLYGTSAVFGVVSIVTKRGRDLNGSQISAEAGSFGTAGARAAFGRRAGGLELYASARVYRQSGQELYYPEYDDPGTNLGVAEFDRDERDHVLIKASRGHFTLLGAFNNRHKQVPTAAWGTGFNDPRFQLRDERGIVALAFDRAFPDGRRLTASTGLHSYSYRGSYPGEGYLYRDMARARWAELQAAWVQPLGPGQKIVVGGEYRRGLRQDQAGWYEGEAGLDFHDGTRTQAWAVFAQDEVRLAGFILNAGARLDGYESFGTTVSPRLGLVYPWSGGAAKILYGRAFRAPTAYELYYGSGGEYRTNPDLEPEYLRHVEVVVEQRVSPGLRATLSAYRLENTGLISLTYDPDDEFYMYTNLEMVHGKGLELGLDFENRGWQGSLSYALQHSGDGAGAELSNSPRHLGQLHLSRSLASDRIRVGTSLRAMSSRLNPAGERVGGHVIGDLTFRVQRLYRGLGGTLGFHNIGNRRYEDPVGEEHLQRAIGQDGRQLRVTLSYEF